MIEHMNILVLDMSFHNVYNIHFHCMDLVVDIDSMGHNIPLRFEHIPGGTDIWLHMHHKPSDLYQAGHKYLHRMHCHTWSKLRSSHTILPDMLSVKYKLLHYYGHIQIYIYTEFYIRKQGSPDRRYSDCNCHT